jgi:ferredoxin--NADP+ reductase
MSVSTTPNEPVLPEAKMHLVRPNEPVRAVITKNMACTAGRKAATFVHHIEFDVSGTPLEGACLVGQSVGVIPPGEDERGRPHQVRLYSLASPSAGEDGAGRILSTTVKRTIDEHWENGKLFLGVASNYLCNAKPGDEIRVSGPSGKRFLLPSDPSAHEYLFIATGTGIAPYRGMVKELLAGGCSRRITLVMGSPYASDLLYHEELTQLAERHRNFTYLTAISRETNPGPNGTMLGKMYVQDRVRAEFDRLRGQLESDANLIYICGIAGMEIGIFQQLAKLMSGSSVEGYLTIEPEAKAAIDAWDRKMLHRQVKHTRRVMLEVYA